MQEAQRTSEYVLLFHDQAFKMYLHGVAVFVPETACFVTDSMDAFSRVEAVVLQEFFPVITCMHSNYFNKGKVHLATLT